MPALYGSSTSPFVRRVRAAALEFGVPLEIRDSREPEHQRALRALSPIWKVPVLVRDDGSPLFDSRDIVEALARPTGWAPLRAPSAEEPNLLNVVDAVTDAIVNRYVIAADGVDVDAIPYLRKQKDRAVASLGWLGDRVVDGHLTSDPRFGFAELALATTLDWLDFRGLLPVEDPRLRAFQAVHRDRPSLAATRPSPTFR